MEEHHHYITISYIFCRVEKDMLENIKIITNMTEHTVIVPFMM